MICYRIQFSGKKHENEVLLKTWFAATLCLQKKSFRREHFTQYLKREGQFAKFRTKGQLAKLLCWTYVWLATVRLHKLGPAIIKIAFTKKQFVKHSTCSRIENAKKGKWQFPYPKLTSAEVKSSERPQLTKSIGSHDFEGVPTQPQFCQWPQARKGLHRDGGQGVAFQVQYPKICQL